MEEKDIMNESDEGNPKLLEVNNGLSENLIHDNNLENENASSDSCFKSILYAIFPYFKKVNTKARKTVYIKDYFRNKTEWSNKIENQKYNLITFVPVVLFNQFKQFGNFFYLLCQLVNFMMN